ncbi:MAG: tetratricopeptide repeat protein [Xanthobacteraceae bacterium]
MNREHRRGGHDPGRREQTGRPAGTTIAELFGAGIAHHQAGRLAEAEELYRRILAAHPNHPDALHLLGLIASQVGRHELAVQLIELAIRQDGKNSLYYSNLGLAFQELQNFAQALESYDRALALRPNYAEALFNRGLTLQKLKRLDEALVSYDGALAVRPNYAEALCNRGVTLAELQRFEAALESYERALAVRPNYAEALSNRGNAFNALQRFEEALASYDRALAVCPDHAEVAYNRGNALNALKRFEEALASYDRALAVRPDYAEALANRGAALHALQRFDDALESYDRALAARTNFAEAFSNRGNTLKALGRLEDALASYDRALAVCPDFVEVLYNRAVALHELNRFEDALASYDRALAVNPDHAEARCNRGVTLQKLQRFDAALESYDRALAVRTDYAEALSNRGVTLRNLRRFNDALESYDRALAVRPDYAEALSNRGVTLQELRRFEDALASYDRALAIRPEHAEALSNRGGALQELKRFEDALASYDRALALRPDYAQAHWNRALLRLLTGCFAEGWRGYEWRRKLESWVPRSFARPEWSGDDPAGRRLLLYSEQGFGDTIQFARYAPLAAARGARVVLEVQPPLKSLLSGLTGVEVVAAKGEPLPPFDAQCSLLSLPLMFNTTVETIPAVVPYIHAPADRIEAWKRRLPHDAPLVGLVWSGSGATTRDLDRSIAFEQLAPLLEVSGIRFVSLQKDVRASDAGALREHNEVIDLCSDLKDFSDTAAVVAQLDLVISVDTAVAHLAGAMGKPVWVLLPYLPDFRWLLDRDDSPWYPSARLFRQSAARDWDEVMACVGSELAATGLARTRRFST